MPESVAGSKGDGIRFILDGKVLAVDDVDPTQSVLGFLRERLGRTGTKEGCAEGDCGACTVVVGELAGDDVALHAVNACIQFVPTLDGKALFTVEDLRQPDGALHPVQQAMVDCHGSQCGFCTPGFVMSLWALYLEHQPRQTRPTDARDSQRAHRQPLPLHRVSADPRCRRRGCSISRRRASTAPRCAGSCARSQRDASLVYEHDGRVFFAPRSIAELTALRASHPQATILAGSTDIGLWVTKQLRELADDHLHRVRSTSSGRYASSDGALQHRRRGHADRRLPRAGAALSRDAARCGSASRRRRSATRGRWAATSRTARRSAIRCRV